MSTTLSPVTWLNKADTYTPSVKDFYASNSDVIPSAVAMGISFLRCMIVQGLHDKYRSYKKCRRPKCGRKFADAQIANKESAVLSVAVSSNRFNSRQQLNRQETSFS